MSHDRIWVRDIINILTSNIDCSKNISVFRSWLTPNWRIQGFRCMFHVRRTESKNISNYTEWNLRWKFFDVKYSNNRASMHNRYSSYINILTFPLLLEMHDAHTGMHAIRFPHHDRNTRGSFRFRIPLLNSLLKTTKKINVLYWF